MQGWGPKNLVFPSKPGKPNLIQCFSSQFALHGLHALENCGPGGLLQNRENGGTQKFGWGGCWGVCWEECWENSGWWRECWRGCCSPFLSKESPLRSALASTPASTPNFPSTLPSTLPTHFLGSPASLFCRLLAGYLGRNSSRIDLRILIYFFVRSSSQIPSPCAGLGIFGGEPLGGVHSPRIRKA